MFKAIISFIMATINVLSVLLGSPAEVPADNGVIDISFDAVNGSEIISYTAENGSYLTEPEVPQKRGLVFEGWYSDGKKWIFEEDTVSEDMTLTAKWGFGESFFEPDENAAERADGANLRIMSFNILASDWNNKPPVAGRDELFMQVIERYAPDVIGMQEVNAEWYESLGEKWGKYRFVNENNIKIGEYVNYSTIAYNSEKFTLIKHYQKRYVVYDSKNCRNIIWALFEDNSTKKRFIVTSTHWELTSDLRVCEAIELAGIVTMLQTLFKVPIFCTGDYNAREGSSEYYAFAQISGFNSTKYAAKERGLVCNSAHLGDGTGSAEDFSSGYWKLGPESFRQSHINTATTIDHIFASPEAEILYYDTVTDDDALNASDHCPIYADVKM